MTALLDRLPPAPALTLVQLGVDLVLGAVLFVLVVAVTAVLMVLLQAVLPGGDVPAATDQATEATEAADDDEAPPAALAAGA